MPAMQPDPMKKLRVKTLPGRPNHRPSARGRIRGRHIFIFLLLLSVGILGYTKFYLPWKARPVNSTMIVPAASPALESALPITPPVQKTESAEKFEVRHQTLQSDDTLASVLERIGISENYVSQWENACKSSPFRIREDDEVIFFLNRADGQPSKVVYLESEGASYTLRKVADIWECNFQDSVPKEPLKTVRGRYAENFYDSCVAGGLPVALIPSLADIFAYDIDFASDFQDGDTFTVLFQEQPIAASEGRQFLIVAAEMNVSGKTFQAFGFQLPDGSWDYFDAKGTSLKRAFLRSPMSYRRLMSASVYKNIKPVLKIYRPHLGIDYSAPRGTPVSAIGDGVVSDIHKSGKYGLAVEMRHRGGFKSVYGNLSGFSRGLKRGSLVLQGEIIGSVGSVGSGKAFLDFHLFREGKAVNFQTVEFVRLKSVPKNMIPEFEKTRNSYSVALQGKVSGGQKQEMLSGSE